MGLYLSSIERRIGDLNSRSSIIDLSVEDFYVEQDLARIQFDARKKFVVRNKRPYERLSSIINKERFVLVEAGMGFGKSRLLRQAAFEYAQHKNFAANRVLPVFLNFRDLLVKFSNSIDEILSYLKDEEHIEIGSCAIVLLIDGIDEVKGGFVDKAEKISTFISQLMSFENFRVVFASRPFDDPVAEQLLEKAISRYELQPLTSQKILSFVERICTSSSVTSRFKGDLERSDLFRSLPRTPITAILLARVFASNVKELPSTLPELYSKYLDLALGRWELSKGGVSEKEYETTVIVTRLFAKTLMDNDLTDLSVGDAKEIVLEYLSKRETGQNPNTLFDRIVGCSEVIGVDEVKNKLFFRHRTFLEFIYAENVFVSKGGSADISQPFDPYWGSVNYFYLGKLKDCPEQLRRIFKLIPSSERELLVKIMQAGSYLLAGYQSPYKDITYCVRNSILEAAQLYCDVCEKPSSSGLGGFSEVQLLALLTSAMRHSFEYDFFKRALMDIEADLLLNVDHNKVNTVAAFFVAAIRAGLGCRDAFSQLISDHLSALPIAVKLGVTHASADAEITNDALKKHEKKLMNARKRNPAYIHGLKMLYETPLVDRSEPRLV